VILLKKNRKLFKNMEEELGVEEKKTRNAGKRYMSVRDRGPNGMGSTKNIQTRSKKGRRNTFSTTRTNKQGALSTLRGNA